MKLKVTIFLCSAFLFLYCGKSTEVTIVDDSGSILPDENAPSQTTTAEVEDDFTILKLGEASEIKTLDPLFANTSGELRVNSLIYDGLTQLSEGGMVEPALAKKWTISRDSLRYTFTLKEGVFYHNNIRFTSGIGKQVSTADIVMNFERMASISVPDNAADLFSNIKGFNQFHTEQTYIKIPSDRTIKSIEGISVPNDSTVGFILQKKDPNFLKKLAHPYASVYPKESLQADKSPIYEAIGTGGYYVAQRKKNLLILASNDDYHLEQAVPNRLDIAHGLKESDLYQQFARGELDVLIEPGPGTVVQVTDTSGNIDPIFSSEFSIKKSDATNNIHFYYNNASQKSQLFNYLTSQGQSFLSFDGALGSIQFPGKSQQIDTLIKTTAYIAFSENSTKVYLIDKIAEKLSSAGINVVMNSSYAVTDDVAFSTNNFPSATPTITWKYPVYILSKTNVSGIKISSQPWNISFENTKISTVQ